jgi:GNAT superfamily N-acetyltransferase
MVHEAMSPNVLFASDAVRAIALTDRDLPALQRFFEANADYFELVNGAPPPAGEAAEEMHGALPPGWPYTKKWILGLRDDDGSMRAMVNIVSDLLAPTVWHVGTYIVDQPWRGTGAARRWCDALECWAKANGARWMRLGVVAGNARAEAFWAARGYREVRVRERIEMGARVNTVRVLVKPLAGGALDDYLVLVPRDRPDA